jgi:hypothetical protein
MSGLRIGFGAEAWAEVKSPVSVVDRDREVEVDGHRWGSFAADTRYDAIRPPAARNELRRVTVGASTFWFAAGAVVGSISAEVEGAEASSSWCVGIGREYT